MGPHSRVRADKKRTFRDFGRAHGDGGGAATASGSAGSRLTVAATGVELDLVARGRTTWVPRGEIPLDRRMDRGFVGHQVSDTQTAFAQMEARLTAGLSTQLATQRAEQDSHWERRLAERDSHWERRLADQDSKMQAQLATLHRATTVPFVCNVAAQCLNQALGKGGQPESRAFASAMGKRDGSQHLKQLVKGVFGATADTDSTGKLDHISTRRNICAHVANSEQQLAAAVQQALEDIIQSSIVAELCADEMLVLGTYLHSPDMF